MSAADAPTSTTGRDIDALLQDPYYTAISASVDAAHVQRKPTLATDADAPDSKSSPPRAAALAVASTATDNDSIDDQPKRRFLDEMPLPLTDTFSVTTADGMSITDVFKNQNWENLLNKVFKSVPANEPLFVEHNCAFQGDHILLQGKLYLTPNFFCFHANIFGYLTVFEFPIQDIILVERAKTALIIPNAIVISTSSKNYFFTSFINRENAFMNMEYLIARHRESHAPRKKGWAAVQASLPKIIASASAKIDDSSAATNSEGLETRPYSKHILAAKHNMTELDSEDDIEKMDIHQKGSCWEVATFG
ncbi:GRAM-domain-containing protein [Rhizoclosmatium globosum]|uniref:GRAM-domain-containing protein n=1 Tax=Rhizoclosmatium globosum TaxID=329046 RepID=A0A1Y2D151_9FUNG|nr:GRAM-domain-containing protein [Rhizoclosmatium globosum]|eukprot:ORY52937.1 GRAM-domain-containing protein [Rhizoclosmatium globosum]